MTSAPLTSPCRPVRAPTSPLCATASPPRKKAPERGGVDTAIVPADLRQADRKLLIMDVDSTLIQQEVIELLAAYAGKRDEVAAVTEAAMRGELDFAQSLHARVAVLAGLPAAVVDSVRAEVKLSEGAAELVAAFKAAGHVVAVVSGGFNQILRPIAEDLGLDYWIANELEIVDGALTGKVLGDVIDRAAKEKYLREWAAAEGIAMEHTIAVGDGANDLDMLGAAGIGVAFNAKPAVRAVADAADQHAAPGRRAAHRRSLSRHPPRTQPAGRSAGRRRVLACGEYRSPGIPDQDGARPFRVLLPQDAAAEAFCVHGRPVPVRDSERHVPPRPLPGARGASHATASSKPRGTASPDWRTLMLGSTVASRWSP